MVNHLIFIILRSLSSQYTFYDWIVDKFFQLFFSLITEDVLSDEKGECVICLEELQSGDVIARLPCLCIYHKKYV